MALDWIGFSYAVLVSVGGVIGFVKADSVPSLAAGLLFGLLAAVGAYLTSHNPKECVAVAGHLWNSHCGDGPEIHQLREVHASGFNDFIQRTDAGEDHNWDVDEATRILKILKSNCV
ncbi:unnamed protein product [Pleuronectes platessa]|uniref:Transmembrane protein 14C n=1 Tax=Pleuronectes platessa TaxID=8262 RepID=A0A9N7YSN9_PLEPL|nr:unnamed protein product [Pleuronectes platessa]